MSWDGMLAKYRALGGVAENACLREGTFGRGVFAIDPAMPVRLFTPASMLILLDDIDYKDGQFRIAESASISEQTRDFLEEYEQEFGWNTGGAQTEELVRMVHAAPTELRAFLDQPLNANYWLIEPTPALLRKRFATSRAIIFQDKLCYMPVIELCNHSHIAKYQFDGGISVHGVFDGEVLVGYGTWDAWQMFANWGFASTNEDFALSLNIGVKTDFGPLRIRRDQIENMSSQVPFFPKVETRDATLSLSYLLVGHKKFPRLPRGIFRRVVSDAGRANADELFDRVLHFNRTQFYKLIALSEDAPPKLGRLLREAAGHQLEAMSWSIGAREV